MTKTVEVLMGKVEELRANGHVTPQSGEIHYGDGPDVRGPFRKEPGTLQSEILEHCPMPPDGAVRVPLGYGGCEKIDVGNERWRFQFGRPVAYFRYTTDPDDPKGPGSAVWLEEWCE
jgi:hypothetical protein